MLTGKERKATALLERFIPDGPSHAATAFERRRIDAERHL